MAPTLTFDFNNTLGAVQIGVAASCVLFGVTITQTYIYYSRFPDDSCGLKFLVAFVWSGNLLHVPSSATLSHYSRFFEGAHVVCLVATQYQWTVSDFGNYEGLLLVPWTIVISVAFSGIIGASVQAFFAFRIYRLSQSLYIPGVSWLLSCSRVLLSITVAAYGSERNVLIATFERQRAWMFYTLWLGATVNDSIIAGTSVYWLYRRRQCIEGRMRSAAVVDKLIAWTIETGVITGASSFLITFMFIAMHIWLAIYTVTARLYANSLLASLNSRATLRAINEHSMPFSVPAFHTMPAANLELSAVSRCATAE
ncbi:hypothetical protein FB451DRAFT_1567673 [Mycena latifolia]|nr:hypothetical protein FB451DRAFT_1567673 [Mycena latifolia]